MKTILFNFLFILLFISCQENGKNKNSQQVSMDGHERGNGGDEVRHAFINLGNETLIKYKFMLNQIFEENVIDQMKETLSVDRILLSNRELFDHSDSQVAAIENNGIITLYIGNTPERLSWGKITEEPSPFIKLVLHELIRSAGINDDNYIYTDKIIQPQKYISLSFDTLLPKGSEPFLAEQIIEHGIRKQNQKTSNHCGKAYQYDLYVTGKIQCAKSEKMSLCNVKEALSNSFLMSFNTKNDAELVSFINDYASKVIIKCSYSAEQVVNCSDGTKRLTDSYSCSLKFPEHYGPDGQRLLSQQQQQQQQQQQSAQTQSRQQNQKPSPSTP